MGHDFVLKVTLANHGAMVRTIDGRVVGMTTQYTGNNTKPFLYMEFNGVITRDNVSCLTRCVRCVQERAGR